MTKEDPSDEVALITDVDDEFDEDYEDPGSLTAGNVGGTVIYTLDWAVSTVVQQIDANPEDPESVGVLVTDPPFQRRTAWTAEKQGLFLESLMLGLPVPPLVLAESKANEGQFYVLDGKQRLTSLKSFFDKQNPLKLRGLELLKSELANKTYGEIRESKDLRKYTKSLLAQPIRTIVVRNWESPALLHLIFSRLNKASAPLASHELRQAIYPGPFTNYVNKTSAESVQMLRARRITKPDFRLRDAEMLLRYFSFKTNLPKYGGVLRDFLDRVLKGGNDHFEEIEGEIDRMFQDLEFAIDATFKVFGKLAFLRFDAERGEFMPRFNVSVFEIMTWYFVDPTLVAKAIKKREAVKEAFKELCVTDGDFAQYLTSTTKTKTAAIGRLKKWGSSR
ncbi:DUF262 domain-containing protein [Amycolatopsis mongoliensis]|uniref:DUF262 domain-containing protein n=1 Tax=Amycolatopsis mongoliensis TaxID=715475 RepID=A0A9Y2NGT5_9PSEU|nr:DUF262 domain-containing protein [Amycolatopsis sp. 4-36]WIY05101.1 DUF262 domain-containing protein [Amycolatopsis sp. 4-36]